MGEYSKAFSFAERAVDIEKHALPANHPSLEFYKKYLEVLKNKL
jgi:hypothetical protein